MMSELLTDVPVVVAVGKPGTRTAFLPGSGKAVRHVRSLVAARSALAGHSLDRGRGADGIEDVAQEAAYLRQRAERGLCGLPLAPVPVTPAGSGSADGRPGGE